MRLVPARRFRGQQPGALLEYSFVVGLIMLSSIGVVPRLPNPFPPPGVATGLPRVQRGRLRTTRSSRFLNDERGEAEIEYAVCVLLIVLAVVAAVAAVGAQLTH